MAEYFVGIDVSKEKLDIAVLGESIVTQAANDKTGIMELRKKLLELKPELIVSTSHF
jgi:hypothetical protein